MFNLFLFEPEIPPNTGNIIRLCANTGVSLHLVKPLGSRLNHRQLQRAGLDYHEFASIKLHENWECCREFFSGRRAFAVSTRGKQRYDALSYKPDDGLRLRNTRPAAIHAGKLCGTKPHSATHVAAKQKPESRQRRRNNNLRSMAPKRIQRWKINQLSAISSQPSALVSVGFH